MKLVYVDKNNRDVMDNALAYLDREYFTAMTWHQEQVRWKEAFGLTIHRMNGRDHIIFPNEKSYTMFLLRWS